MYALLAIWTYKNSNRPYVCVKCGGMHSTSSCKKNRDASAKYAFYVGPYPANYRSCYFYHRLIDKPNNTNNRLNIQNNTNDLRNTPKNNRMQATTPVRSNISYATALRGNSEQNNVDNFSVLNKFPEEFTAMFQQLTQQNSMMVNMPK